MGYLTTIVIHNDAFHEFKEHPEKFGNAIIDGVYAAQREGRQVDVGFFGYANYISVEPSRHADDHTVYVHYGNTIFNLNPWNKDFEEFVSRDPEGAEKFVNVAQDILTNAKKEIKKQKLILKKKMEEILKSSKKQSKGFVK